MPTTTHSVNSLASLALVTFPIVSTAPTGCTLRGSCIGVAKAGLASPCSNFYFSCLAFLAAAQACPAATFWGSLWGVLAYLCGVLSSEIVAVTLSNDCVSPDIFTCVILGGQTCPNRQYFSVVKAADEVHVITGAYLAYST